MICPQCQSENPDQARFCNACGTRLDRREQAAGGRSGLAVQQEPGLPAVAERPLPVPEALAAKLEAARIGGAMVGERRIVTMLFCDLVGSTAAADQLDPEEWTEIVNGAFERMITPVYRYEGVVARLMGDAILAFFGAPIAHEDDPQRAVLAGLDIVRDMAPYRTQVKRSWQIELDVRVGINTGLVVVGEVGSDLRMEYTALGDAINVAARMEQTALPGTVQLGPETYRLVSPLFDMEPVGPITLKGKEDPIPVYRVLGPKREPGQIRGLATHGIGSALVGRDGEIDALRRRIKELYHGRGALVGLFGEAGLGKSRLIAELQQEVADSGAPVRWLEARTLSYGKSMSYWPFQELLWRYAGITEEDDESRAWQKIEGQLDALFGDESQEVLPYLAGLLSLALPATHAERLKYLDAEDMRSQVYLNARRFVARLAQQEPLVLVFEDVHWMDESSAGLLQHLLPLVQHEALLIVMVSRPEAGSPGSRLAAVAAADLAEWYTEIRLAPLSGEDSSQLIANLLAIEALPVHVRQLMLQRADGNPFFLEEIIRSLIDTGAVVRDEGTGVWRATEKVDKVAIPDTIQGVIMARIDRLTEETKQVLRSASVIGRSFLYRVLRAVSEAGVALDRELSELQAIQLIREKQAEPELEYVFKHALAQEATYDSILRKQRRQLHVMVGEAIETLFADRLEEFYGLLAYHFARAEAWDRAQSYLFRAGDAAGRVAADAEALVYYRQAMAAYDRAFGDEWDPVQRAQLERKMGEALFRSGDHTQALTYLERALAHVGESPPGSTGQLRRAILKEAMRQLAHRLLPAIFPRGRRTTPDADAQEKLKILESIAWVNVVTNPERFILTVLRGLNEAEQNGDVPWTAFGYAGVVTAAGFIGAKSLGSRYARLGLALAEKSDDPKALGYILQALCMHLSWLGQAEAAIQHGKRSAQIRHDTGFVRGWGAATMLTAETLIYLGDRASLAEAERLVAELISLGEDGQDANVLSWGYANLGGIRRLRGQYRAAVDALKRTLELAAGIPDHVVTVADMAEIGQCYLEMGDVAAAVTILDEGREYATRHQVRGGRFMGRVHNGLAEAHLAAAIDSSGQTRTDHLEEADRSLRQGRKQCRQYPPWLAWHFRLMGTAGWLRGRETAARKWWQRSLEQAESMGQGYEAGRTWQEMGRHLTEPAFLERAEAILSEIRVGPVESLGEEATAKCGLPGG